MTKIAGIWDLLRSGGTLGTLLILLEELQVQRRIHQADTIDVIVAADAKQLCGNEGAERFDRSGGDTGSRIETVAPLIAVLRAMECVSGIHVCTDAPSARKTAEMTGSDCIVWPPLETLIEGRHNYDSTRVVRDYFARAGEIPALCVTPELSAWAKGYLEHQAAGRLPVAAHLKNDPAAAGRSNANAGAWLAFMERCERDQRVHFVLVGDDAVPAQFRALSNVTIAKDDGVALDRTLALIQAAGLFMGMMSGPANMALFGTNPYLIFKNPDHHAREMAEEIGSSDRYSFARAGQRVLRVWDTTENLVQAFRYALEPAARR